MAKKKKTGGRRTARAARAEAVSMSAIEKAIDAVEASVRASKPGKDIAEQKAATLRFLNHMRGLVKVFCFQSTGRTGYIPFRPPFGVG